VPPPHSAPVNGVGLGGVHVNTPRSACVNGVALGVVRMHHPRSANVNSASPGDANSAGWGNRFYNNFIGKSPAHRQRPRLVGVFGESARLLELD